VKRVNGSRGLGYLVNTSWFVEKRWCDDKWILSHLEDKKKYIEVKSLGIAKVLGEWLGTAKGKELEKRFEFASWNCWDLSTVEDLEAAYKKRESTTTTKGD